MSEKTAHRLNTFSVVASIAALILAPVMSVWTSKEVNAAEISNVKERQDRMETKLDRALSLTERIAGKLGVDAP